MGKTTEIHSSKRSEDLLTLRKSIEGLEQNILAGESQIANMRKDLEMQRRLLAYTEQGIEE